MDTLTTLKIMPVKPCNRVQNLPFNASAFLDSHRMTNPTPFEMAKASERALKRLDEAMAEDEQIHVENAEALENNMRIAGLVREFMLQIGVHERYSEYKTVGRSRNKKHVVEEAGWVQDLKRCVIVTDGLDKAKESYHRIKFNYENYAEKARVQVKQAEHDAQAEEGRKRWQREADLALARVIIRYDLDPMSTWDSALEVLRTKNQRLDLAIAMAQTRNDWSDGFWRVRDALDRFTPESDEDADIFSAVSGECSSDWGDDDGRVFRDMQPWNYDTIFGTIEDKQLVEDALTAMSYI